jgi:hypothetical protein
MTMYRIIISRYPTRTGILVNPEVLNQAYEKIKNDWKLEIKDNSRIGLLECSCLDYEFNNCTARVVVPKDPNIRDIVIIELGALNENSLESAARGLNLPYDTKSARLKEKPTSFNII